MTTKDREPEDGAALDAPPLTMVGDSAGLACAGGSCALPTEDFPLSGAVIAARLRFN